MSDAEIAAGAGTHVDSAPRLALERAVASRLFDSLDYYTQEPAQVLDVGCGRGRGTALLRKRWRGAQVIAQDVSLARLHQARRHARWWRPFARVCAQARALPFPDHGIDVVHCNLWMAGCEDPRVLFREFARVLKPGGFVVASTLGPDSFGELRAACAASAGDRLRIAPFRDMHEVGDAALAAGLKDPVLDTDRLTLHYGDVPSLFSDLVDLGVLQYRDGVDAAACLQEIAGAPAGGRREPCIPATFELVTMHAWGFPAGALPLYGGRETPFEVVRRRDPGPPAR